MDMFYREGWSRTCIKGRGISSVQGKDLYRGEGCTSGVSSELGERVVCMLPATDGRSHAQLTDPQHKHRLQEGSPEPLLRSGI